MARLLCMHDPATLCTVQHLPVTTVIFDAVVRDLAVIFKSLEIFSKASLRFISITAVLWARFINSK